jgi:hypothetical protein
MKRIASLCLLIISLLLLLSACGSFQEQTKSSEINLGENEDPVYYQLERLATAPKVSMSLTDTFGETFPVTTRQNEAGELILEGDMIVGQTGTGELSSQGHIYNNIKFWWRGVVPYTIDPKIPSWQRTYIFEAIRHIMVNTNVTFVARTNQPNWVNFRPSDECSAVVGRRGGYQYINLATYCDKGTIIHEIGHALGLAHEHSRTDRNTYIYMDCSSVDCTSLRSWGKFVGDLYGPYDYRSVMHYGAFYGGKQVISSKNPAVKTSDIGGNWLSDGDIKTLRSMYPYPVGSYD